MNDNDIDALLRKEGAAFRLQVERTAPRSEMRTLIQKATVTGLESSRGKFFIYRMFPQWAFAPALLGLSILLLALSRQLSKPESDLQRVSLTIADDDSSETGIGEELSQAYAGLQIEVSMSERSEQSDVDVAEFDDSTDVSDYEPVELSSPKLFETEENDYEDEIVVDS